MAAMKLEYRLREFATVMENTRKARVRRDELRASEREAQTNYEECRNRLREQAHALGFDVNLDGEGL